MTDRALVIVDGVRTPFSRMGTDLADLRADELGRIAVNGLLTRSGVDPDSIDEVIFGCVGQPVEAMNVARVIGLRAGIREGAPAVTVQRNCASGCEAVTQAFEKMQAGKGEVFVVGGVESMSQIPFLFPQSAARKFTRLQRARTFWQRLKTLSAFRPSDFRPRIGLELGLTDPVSGLNTGETAELLAGEWNISREEQDAFALNSHNQAIAARERLAEEICPVYTDRGKAVLSDNGPREGSSIKALGQLRPVFDRRLGTVTAGNSSQVTDGAAALLVMTEDCAHRMNLQPLGRLIGYSYVGCDPARMGMGPLFAIARLQEQIGLEPQDADLIEINEAFAAQVLAVLKAASSQKFARKALNRAQPLGELPRDRLNVNGGAIALGHPVGVTGSRLILTSLKELRRRRAARALVSLCVGGGQGAAIGLEAL